MSTAGRRDGGNDAMEEEAGNSGGRRAVPVAGQLNCWTIAVAVGDFQEWAEGADLEFDAAHGSG